MLERPLSVSGRQRWTFDSLFLGGKTSTWPRPTKTWPTRHTCTSTALGNSTTRCEYNRTRQRRAALLNTYAALDASRLDTVKAVSPDLGCVLRGWSSSVAGGWPLVSGLCLFSRFHAERAIDIITHILPEDHLLLASSKRVKGRLPGNVLEGFGRCLLFAIVPVVSCLPLRSSSSHPGRNRH